MWAETEVVDRVTANYQGPAADCALWGAGPEME